MEKWLADYDKRYDGWRTGQNAGKRVPDPEVVKRILACKPEFLSLGREGDEFPPPLLLEDDLRLALTERLLGKKRLGTQNPCTISDLEYGNFINLKQVKGHPGWSV